VLGEVLDVFMAEPVWAAPQEVSTPGRPTAVRSTGMSTPEPIPPLHPLENPVIWLLLQVAEYTVVILLFRWLLPDGMPLWIGFALFGVLIAVLTVVNIAIRRRFIPH
jgi:hypothetical protein